MNLTPFFNDDRNRLRDYKANGSALTRTYRYNGKGERVSKTVAAGNTNNRYYTYDESGHLLGEYLASGVRVQEYVWMDDTLVAVFSDHDTTTYQYVQTDHLGTPRAVINPVNNAIIWRWNLTNTAFGEHAPVADPDGNTVSYTFNLRYPGQWYDTESKLHYNYFRDYDPATGRYIESDPIGLSGGPSTYAYVGGNPAGWTDPSGLCAKKCGIKTAPEYDVSGSAPGGTAFHWSARFLDDATHDPKCCEVRQQISRNRGGAPHGGFKPPRDQPNSWYEDRDQNNKRYGRRTGPYSDLHPTFDWYDRDSYNGMDKPSGFGPGVVLKFRLTVVDVCNKGQAIYTSKSIGITF